MTTESFVLEAIDTLTQCIEVDVLFRVDNVEELCNTLEREAAGFNPKLMYDLDTSDVEKLMVRYGLKFDPWIRSIVESFTPSLARSGVSMPISS